MYVSATMISSTTLQLVVAVFVIVLCTFLMYCTKVKNSKPEEPVMENGRAKGMMALGNKNYELK